MNELEGPQITALVREMLNVVAQKGCEALVLQPCSEGYLAVLQKNRQIEFRPFKGLAGIEALPMIRALEKLVDIREAKVPIVRHGKVKLKLDGRNMILEIVSVPYFKQGFHDQSMDKPTMTVHFSVDVSTEV